MLLKLRVVEDVEVLEPQFQARPSLFEWNVFEQGPIEVEEPRPHDHVFSGTAKALVWAPIPGSSRICKRAGAEPCQPFLWVRYWRHQVRTIRSAAAQTERVGASIMNDCRYS